MRPFLILTPLALLAACASASQPATTPSATTTPHAQRVEEFVRSTYTNYETANPTFTWQSVVSNDFKTTTDTTTLDPLCNCTKPDHFQIYDITQTKPVMLQDASGQPLNPPMRALRVTIIIINGTGPNRVFTNQTLLLVQRAHIWKIVSLESHPGHDPLTPQMQ